MKLETCLVQAHTHTHQMITCSITDQYLSIFAVPVIFFYRTRFPHDVLIDSLKTALNDFPIFAGTFTTNKNTLYLDCNNAGVRVSITHDDGTLDGVLAILPAIKKARFVDMIHPQKAIAKQEPILTIQLTYFACGGMAIGGCWHHSIGDMQTFMCLMQTWSQTVNGQNTVKPLIVKDRDAYLYATLEQNDNTPPGMRYLKTHELITLMWYMLVHARRKRSVQVYFTENELKNMKQAFSSQTSLQLSTNDVLCAHIFSCISAADDYQKPRILSLAVNYRKRTQLPANLLGNFVNTLNALNSPGVEPTQVAADIREAVNNYTEQHLDIFSMHAYIEQHGGVKHIKRFVPTGIDPINRTLFISNWSNFGIYDIVFGESKPCYFTPFEDLPFPWLSILTDGFSNSGLLYMALLPNAFAKAFMHKENVTHIHQYRDQYEVLPEWIRTLEWVL